MATVEQSRDKLMAELRSGVDRLYTDHILTPEDDVVAVSERMLRSIPRRHVHDERIGPFYDTAGVTRLLARNGRAVSKQAIDDRISRMTILVAKTADGHNAFPAFQFNGNDVDHGLREVLRAFREAPVDGWTIAAWLKAPSPALGGKSAVEWLEGGGEVAVVVASAQDASVRWSAP